jgi:hypothetical protein
MAVLRVVLDNMILDKIVDEPGRLTQVETVVRNGRARLLLTSRQREERDAAAPSRAAELQRVPVEIIGSSPFILGVSRLDVDRLDSSEPYDSLRARASSPKHLNDHQGVTTASSEGAPFVTEDERIHKHAVGIDGVDLWRWADLVRELDAR